jgi:hypothetical protein
MSKIVKAVSPKGKASWPKLFKPDTRFNPDGVYSTGLVVPPKDAKEFQEKIQEVFVDEFGQSKLAKASMPWKEDEDGNVVFSFKSKRKPMVVDSTGKAINEELPVGGGSTIKVAAGLNAYNAGGRIGVSMYLNAVQIVELVEYSSSPFGKEEGGFVLEKETTVAHAETEINEEEDINF